MQLVLMTKEAVAVDLLAVDVVTHRPLAIGLCFSLVSCQQDCEWQALYVVRRNSL